MTTPASKLVHRLIPGATYILRSALGVFVCTLEYADARKMAKAGLIEGVGGKNGAFRCLRQLRDAAVEQDAMEHIVGSTAHRARSGSLNAVTNLGAYQQELATGKVWALKMCKALDGAIAERKAVAA